jgi:hydroxypyruvate isomerase
MLKFSANLSLLFTGVPLLARFKAAKQQGFNAVEIQFPYELSATDIAEQLQQHDLELVLFNVAADDLLQGGEGLACAPEKQAQFREAVLQAVEYAKVLKPYAINVLPGRCYDQSRSDHYRQTLLQNLSFAEHEFSALGVKTVFEAINTTDMPSFLISTGEQMLVVLDALNLPNLLMQYDVYHARMMGGDPIEFIQKHYNRIGHIQFADCPGRGQPGTGAIDFKVLFEAINGSGYTCWVGAEYKPVGMCEASFKWLDCLT